jgi:hypothetical protein
MLVPPIGSTRSIARSARSFASCVIGDDGNHTDASLENWTIASRSSGPSALTSARAASRARSIFGPVIEPERSRIRTALTGTRWRSLRSPSAARSIWR